MLWKEKTLTENRDNHYGFRNSYKIINQWRKLKLFHEVASRRKVKTKMEISNLRNLKIMPRNLSEIVLSWIPSLFVKSEDTKYRRKTYVKECVGDQTSTEIISISMQWGKSTSGTCLSEGQPGGGEGRANRKRGRANRKWGWGILPRCLLQLIKVFRNFERCWDNKRKFQKTFCQLTFIRWEKCAMLNAHAQLRILLSSHTV